MLIFVNKFLNDNNLSVHTKAPNIHSPINRKRDTLGPGGGGCLPGRGGHRHWQVGGMPNTNLIPHLWSKGVKDRTFWKTEGKDRALYRDLCRSLMITISRDRLLHFQWKKTLRPIPQLFHRTKVVSINLPILPFSKICWNPPLLLAVGGVTCDYLSVRNCPRAGEGCGGGEELPLLIENFMEHVYRTVSHAQTDIQRPHMEEIFTKIKNYGQGYRSCPLQRSLLIAVDHDL